jgi:hypothetical protein
VLEEGDAVYGKIYAIILMNGELNIAIAPEI